jgi:hypothetical protein
MRTAGTNRLQGSALNPLELTQAVGSPEHGQAVPSLQVAIDPAGDRELVSEDAPAARSLAQEGGHDLAHDARVARVARPPHAVRAQDRLATFLPGGPPVARAHREEAEVAGSAPEVPDQDELVVVQALFVGVGRSDRLVLERHVGDPGDPKRSAQTLFGEVVVLVALAPSEVHGPARDHAHGVDPELLPRAVAHVLHHRDRKSVV